MPFSKAPRRKFARKPRRKHYKKKNEFSLVISKRPVCPGQLIVPLKYVSEVLPVTCTTGIAQTYLFNFSNIFDPDRTGTGHQPLGRDQWTTFYNAYRVEASKITVWAMNTTDTNPFRMTLNCNGQTTGAAGIDAAQEGRAIECIKGANKEPCKLSMYRTGAQVFNCTKQQYNIADAYRASTGNAPSRQGVWQIYVAPYDETTTTTIDLKVEITYYVRYQNPKFLVQS